MVTYWEWFALCTNKATTTRTHPVLGEVPTRASLSELRRGWKVGDIARAEELQTEIFCALVKLAGLSP